MQRRLRFATVGVVAIGCVAMRNVAFGCVAFRSGRTRIVAWRAAGQPMDRFLFRRIALRFGLLRLVAVRGMRGGGGADPRIGRPHHVRGEGPIRAGDPMVGEEVGGLCPGGAAPMQVLEEREMSGHQARERRRAELADSICHEPLERRAQVGGQLCLGGGAAGHRGAPAIIMARAARVRVACQKCATRARPYDRGVS